jgi:hypothetical protein
MMKKTMLLAGAAMIGAGFLAAHVNAQGVPQTVEITKVDVQRVAAGYRASKVIMPFSPNPARASGSGYANVAPSDSRSVNRYGHGHLVCKFPINVTVPVEVFPALPQ